MSEDNEIRKLRDKLNAYSAPAPDFDELFGDLVPGEAPLRHLVQSKLSGFESPAPSFDELMTAGHKVVPFYKRLYPLWGSVAAAVAVVAFILLMPGISKMDKAMISMAEEEELVLEPLKALHIPVREKKFLTQTLETPKTIKALSLSGDDNETEIQAAHNKDSVQNEIIQIKGEAIKSLKVDNGYNIADVYEQARRLKRASHKNRIKAGINFSGDNRLLAFVNTKENNGFILRGSMDSYAEGMAMLSANATPSVDYVLRAATANKNAWESPYNIPASSLTTYKAQYSLPINFGFSVAIPLNDVFEIHTGLTYTYLSGETSGTTRGSDFNLHQELHYLGIPVKLAINVHEYGKFGLYASFGGSLEKGLVGKQYSTVEGAADWKSSQSISGYQPVIGAQLGATYEIIPSVLLYLEPGANYYISSNQPISSRTEEPFNFNIGFGLRYSFK